MTHDLTVETYDGYDPEGEPTVAFRIGDGPLTSVPVEAAEKIAHMILGAAAASRIKGPLFVRLRLEGWSEESAASLLNGEAR